MSATAQCLRRQRLSQYDIFTRKVLDGRSANRSRKSPGASRVPSAGRTPGAPRPHQKERRARDAPASDFANSANGPSTMSSGPGDGEWTATVGSGRQPRTEQLRDASHTGRRSRRLMNTVWGAIREHAAGERGEPALPAPAPAEAIAR